MFRSALKLKIISNISKHNRNQSLRSYSTTGDKSSSAKIGLIVGSSVVVLSGLTIGYAKYDTNFRKSLENSVPFSDRLLNSVLGPLNPNKDLIKTISDSKDNFKRGVEGIDSFMNKKNERKESVKQNNSKTNPLSDDNKKSDKCNDNLEPLQQTNSTKIETEGTPGTDSKPPEQEKKDENFDFLSDDSLLDVDVMVAREALIDQLMDILPSDDEKLKELQKRSNDIELEYQRKISKLEDKFERELQNQLKRQLAAFNEHLEDQMSNLKTHLNRSYDNALEEKLLEEKNRFQSQLSNSFYRLQVLEDLLKARELLDKEQHSVREVWVLCQALREALHHKPSMAESPSPIHLKEELSSVQLILNKTSLNDKPIIRSALESIPKEVVENGVYSEEDLVRRFKTVDKYCKKVALIGDEGGSLYLYFLSYLQSLLLFRDSKIPKEELEDQEVDPSKWDTFDILTRVSHCLNNNNLEMALKYANQLRGEPRNVAKDWIRDTRTHLEVKQAVTLLQTEADAINVQIIN